MNFIEAVNAGKEKNLAIMSNTSGQTYMFDENGITKLSSNGKVEYVSEILKSELKLSDWELSKEYTFDGKKLEESIKIKFQTEKLYFISCQSLKEALDYVSKNEIPMEAVAGFWADTEYLQECVLGCYFGYGYICEIHEIDKGLISTCINGVVNAELKKTG